jgi:hypothetical protein
MAIRVTGLDEAIKALSEKGTKAIVAISEELEQTAKDIEKYAAQDAPSYIVGMPQTSETKLNINQRIRSEPRAFFQGEAISWEIFVQTNPNNRMDDFDGYMEFNTGLEAAQLLARPGYTDEIRKAAFLYWKTGKGTLKGKPYFYPNVFRFTANLKEKIEKRIKDAIK